MNGYDFVTNDFPTLLLRKFYPERTDRESGLIRDFLLAHLAEYDRVSFSVRVGEGIAPNPAHLPAVQRGGVWSSRRRIDVVCYRGGAVTLVEAKETLRHDVLGQLLSDRQLWLEDHADAEEPALVAIGRFADDDTIRVLRAHGIDVLLYAPRGVTA